jgi:DNA-binding GntR family transcriptional regulator
LLGVRNDIYRRFDRYQNLIFSLESENSESFQLDHEEHEKLAAVALERNKEKMSLLIREHVISSIDDYIEIFKQRELI